VLDVLGVHGFLAVRRHEDFCCFIVIADGTLIERTLNATDWWQDREERTAALRAEQERVARFYEDQQRAKQEREKAAR
jgi:hypothetical protein